MCVARLWGVAALGISLWYGCAAAAQSNNAPQDLPAATRPADGSAPAQPTASQPEHHAATVKLLDAGQEPRRTLRYAPQSGLKQSISIRTRISGSRALGTSLMASQRSPAQVFRMDTEVKAVHENGDIEYLFGITEGNAIGERGMDPLSVKGAQEMAESIIGVTGNATISSTGRTKHMAVVPPPNATRGPTRFIAWTLQSVRNALEQTWTLFPEEQVGVGAKWEVVSYSNANPNYATFKQVAVYQVQSIDHDRIRLEVTLTESADPQVLKNQSTESVPMTLLSHDAKGTGTATMNLKQLMPLLSVMNVDGTTELEIKMSESHQEHYMTDMRVENSVETVLEETSKKQ